MRQRTSKLMRFVRRHARRFGAWATSLAVLCSAPVALRGQTAVSVEYRIKAQFLANFLKFIEWPPNALGNDNSPFWMCSTGYFPFGTALAESTRGELVRGKRIEIRWIRNSAELRSCQVLFVSESEAKNYQKILTNIHGAAILSVGETPDFLDAGGTVAFFFQEKALQFDVNLSGANAAGLKISARLLSVARHVIGVAVSAKN